MWFVLEYRID